MTWTACPIDPTWITHGDPRADISPLSDSRDSSLSVGFWRCTAGEFTWAYSVDEDIVILEGTASIRIDGIWRAVRAGDSVSFAKGSTADWMITTFVRKVYVIRQQPKSLLRRVVGRIVRIGKRGES